VYSHFFHLRCPRKFSGTIQCEIKRHEDVLIFAIRQDINPRHYCQRHAMPGGCGFDMFEKLLKQDGVAHAANGRWVDCFGRL
jgi:hypothetical protein